MESDLDENAITAVGENLEANGIAPEQFKVVQGNIIDDKAVQDEVKYEYYDIAVANILAGRYHHAAERDPGSY